MKGLHRSNIPLALQADHHGCKGTGIGSNRDARCRPCGGTGHAAPAFGSLLRKRGIEDSSLILDEDIDEALDAFVTSIYGERTTLVDFTEDDEARRGAYVFTVLQNVIDREAMRTVRALGLWVAVFTWLRGEEKNHCPEGAEKEWEP